MSFEITKLLQLMVQHDASDLYLTAEAAPQYRVNGVLRPAGTVALKDIETEALANSIMSDKQQSEFLACNEMNLALQYPGMGRFRVNVFRQRGAIGVVVRQIKMKILGVDDLELPQVLKEIALTKRGLVLVVGSTGSGKSTTLAAIVDYRNQNTAGHIITIEDPIEFVHMHKKCIVTQR